MLPDEKVETKFFGDIDAYLIESRSLGGVSGSPVFFCKPQQTNKGLTPGIKVYLGGLIHGHWDTLRRQNRQFFADRRRTKKQEHQHGHRHCNTRRKNI